MLPTLIRRAAQKTPTPESAAYVAKIRALYPPKKVWPPDFTKLSPQEQLRYEKKYKRRMALATARPRWDRFIKLTQLFSMVSVLVYAVLFMDWKQSQQPFGGLRETFWNALGYDYDHASQKPISRKSLEYSSQSR